VIKFLVVLYRRRSWDHEQFLRYFRTIHEPLASALPGLQRYVYNVPADDPNRSKPAWDAVVELFFADYASMQAAWDTAEGENATSDLPRFADLELSTWSVVDERIVIEGPAREHA
jgi:uncharacterized protein (TIGR02118 family)